MKSEAYSMTKPLFPNIFPDNISTFISDRSIDFSLHELENPFNSKQRDYLGDRLKVSSKQIVNVKQVHGNKIFRAGGYDTPMVEADGILTNQYRLPIVVRTADCLPIFLYDPTTQVMGLIHAGWRGTQLRIVEKAVKEMVAWYGVHPGDIVAAFGPCISVDHYRVGAEFKDIFPDETILKEGKFYFNLVLANENQMRCSGILPEHIFKCDVCTYANTQYFSYRRDGEKAGRILSFMMREG